MAMPSSSPPDPPTTTATTASAAATTTTTTTTPRLFPNPRAPISLPQPHYTVQSQQQQQQQPSPLYTVQSLSNIAPRGPTTTIRPQLAKPRDPPPPGILYPVASSGRGFLPRAIRPQLPDQTVTIAANPGGGGFPPRPVVPYPHPVRGYGFPHSDPHPGQSVHLIKPTHLQHTLVGSTGGVVKGVPVSTHPKVAPPPPPSSVSDCNGYKDIRDRNRDDNFSTVRDRKVRISEDASLYALCRSWLRNGFPEEIQPQYMDGVKSLPRPLPISVGEAHSPVNKESDKEEEDEGLVEHLSPQELLQSHIKRAKRVRARLREERLKRIARYKTRLALLLPPIVEQQLRNDTAAGN